MLKTRFDEFVERTFAQAKNVQADSLLLVDDKLQDKLLNKLSETLLATVRHQIDEFFGCQPDTRPRAFRVQTMWMTPHKSRSQVVLTVDLSGSLACDLLPSPRCLSRSAGVVRAFSLCARLSVPESVPQDGDLGASCA